MIRYRYHMIIALGRFAEAVDWIKELNAVSAKHGLTPGKLWAPSFGKTNACVFEIEYPDWPTFHRENDKFFGTAEIMKKFRDGIPLQAPGQWPWDEMLEEAPILA